MNDNKKSVGVGLSSLDVLQIAFIVLKLCGVITWSWVWVLSPLWISFIISILVVVAFYIKFH